MLIRLVKDWEKEDDICQQTLNHSCQWNGTKFTFDPVEKCDVVVFFNRIKDDISIQCRKGGRWLIQMEPPTPAHSWYRKSDSQVDLVIGPARSKYCKNYEKTHGALPWHLMKDYDFLKNLDPNKGGQLEVSMITSNANWMAGHEFRNEVVKSHQDGLMTFDLFGRGYNPIKDKFDALFPYRFSIVIENSFYPNYWTEKIADCLLSWTVPIYIGAPNINQFFPEKSVIQVEPNIRSLKRVLENLSESDYSERLKALGEARELILEKYQLFPFIASKLNDAKLESEPFENYHLTGIKAPWEGGLVPFERKLQYQWRKWLNKKPY